MLNASKTRVYFQQHHMLSECSIYASASGTRIACSNTVQSHHEWATHSADVTGRASPETSFTRKLQIMRRKLIQAFGIDRPRAFGSFVFTKLNTRVRCWLFLCADSRRWSRVRKKRTYLEYVHGEAAPSAQALGPWPVESFSLLASAGNW